MTELKDQLSLLGRKTDTARHARCAEKDWKSFWLLLNEAHLYH